jgi:maltose alpha-D-glucosyltransferase/alpha-amylase
VWGNVTHAYRALKGEGAFEPRVLKVEQSNTSVAYGERLIFKLFRRLETGISPDLEIGRFLTERVGLLHVPPLAGWLEYRVGRAEPRTMAVLNGFVPNQGDAWEYTKRELNRYFERAATRSSIVECPPRPLTELLEEQQPDPAAIDMIGVYIEIARMLGQRTAELHLALASDHDDPNFAPEPFTPFYQRATFQSMRNLTEQTFRLLRNRQAFVPEDSRKALDRLLAHPEHIASRFDNFLKCKMTALRIRAHGDLHLGQVLYTGKDFVIIDFEGEPARPLSDRRRKRTAIRDVSGMLRSFHYAAFGTLLEDTSSGALGKRDFASMEPWARLWQVWSSWAFLKGYLDATEGASFIPRDRDELKVLLDAFMLEKAVYELGYELNNRPDWIRIPMHGIEQILGDGAGV